MKKQNESKVKNNKIILVIVLLSISFLFSVIGNFFLIFNRNLIHYKNDENIVFFGDSITNGYDVEKFFPGKYVVNSGKSGDKTEDLIERINKDVYKYNPSKVILLIGINDIFNGIDTDDIISNIDTIIKEIKMNRPYADIYVESIYPINEKKIKNYNEEALNERIVEVNKELKLICDSNKVKYIDLHDKLLDKDGNLKDRYTEDGVHFTNLGYLKVSSILKEYIYK